MVSLLLAPLVIVAVIAAYIAAIAGLLTGGFVVVGLSRLLLSNIYQLWPQAPHGVVRVLENNARAEMPGEMYRRAAYGLTLVSVLVFGWVVLIPVALGMAAATFGNCVDGQWMGCAYNTESPVAVSPAE